MTSRSSLFIGAIVVFAMIAASCAGTSGGEATTATTQATTTTTQATSGGGASASTTQATQPSVSGSPQRGGELTIAIDRDPRNFNPIKDGGYEGDFIVRNVRAGLTQLDADGNVEPSLATSWEQPDPLTYIFHLRKGVKFSDGTPFTSADVKYTFDIVTSDLSAFSGNYTPLIESTEAVDDYTFQVNLKIPWLFFLNKMANASDLRIIKNNWLDECAGDECDTTVIGAGPFMIKEWTKGSELVLERNPYYWNPDEPYVDELVYKIVPDAQTQLIQLQAGQVDILLNVPPAAANALKQDQNITVFAGPSGKSNEIILNTLVPPFNDLTVRRAVLMAIDPQETIDLALFGFGALPTDQFPAYLAEHDEDAKPHVYDPEGAKALLAKAGFDDSNPLSFELRTINTAEFVDQATVVKDQLGRIGVKVKVTPMEKGAFLAPMFREEDPTQWQAGLERYGFTTDPQSFYWEQYAVDSYINASNINLPGGYQLPELEEVVTAALAAPTLEEAKVLYKREWALIQQAAIELRLSYQDNIQAAGPRVHGFKSLTGNEYPLRLVWLEEPGS